MDSSLPRTKVALITGSGRLRLGHVIAESLAGLGYSIALHYSRSAKAAGETAERMRGAGVDCESFQADVAVEEDVDRMFQAVAERFGRLDVLVTTASVWEAMPLERVSAAHVRRNLDVNALGTFLCAQRAGLWMVRQPEGGVIVTIGDWAVKRPYLDYAAYFVSKGAIETMTRVLAVELAHRNPRVRVNCIHPGPVMLPPGTSPAEAQEMVDSTLLKRANCPESVSHAVRFLIENPFVTGICLPVDGGRTIYAPP